MARRTFYPGRICAYCGEAIPARKIPSARFCSDRCHQRATYAQRFPDYQPRPESAVCVRDGCTQSIPSHRRSHARYCSDTCQTQTWRDTRFPNRRHRVPLEDRPRCLVESCFTPQRVEGWCRRHYDIARHHDGNPLWSRVRYVEPRRLTPEERFWAKVDKDARHGGCWIWEGTTHPVSGFGQARFGGEQAYAHHVAYRLVVGPLPAKPLILVNHCDNRACIRPDAAHWFEGTRSDMARHREQRYPQMREIRRASRRGLVMTEEAAAEIRRLRATEHPTYRALAEQFGVSSSLIALICVNQAWAESVAS